jgi:hypothetical protein
MHIHAADEPTTGRVPVAADVPFVHACLEKALTVVGVLIEQRSEDNAAWAPYIPGMTTEGLRRPTAHSTGPRFFSRRIPPPAAHDAAGRRTRNQRAPRRPIRRSDRPELLGPRTMTRNPESRARIRPARR